jgi:hypothetical protein
MRIGIVGAGSASAITAMVIVYAMDRANISNYEITCIHDSSTPITQVGESASGVLNLMLATVLGVDLETGLDEFDATLRHNTRCFWNEANGQEFTVNYGAPGMHINSSKFSSIVFNKLDKRLDNFKLIDDIVTSITQNATNAIVNCKNIAHEFDYVIDATGTPSDDDLASEDYAGPEFKSVNSVILYPDFKEYKEDYTSATVHKNGWMFGVPLQHRKAFGYLYNNTVTSYEDAKKDFEQIKGIDATDARQFSWNQYFRKKVIDGRILYTGNKLYFFEPNQAIPLHYYAIIADVFVRLGTTSTVEYTNQEMNIFHARNIEQIQNLIAINYAGENKLDTAFWKYAKEGSKSRLMNSQDFRDWAKSSVDSETILAYWSHDASLMKDYVNGYKIDLKVFASS